MRRFILLVSYLVYFVYGFLFGCGYIGGNALLDAINTESGVLYALLGIAALGCLFVVSFLWLIGLLRGRYEDKKDLTFRLALTTPLVASFMLYVGASDYRFEELMKLLIVLYIGVFPLLLSVFLSRPSMTKT